MTTVQHPAENLAWYALPAATIVVTATGSATEMGAIAGMVTATQRSKSPLQRELDGMTKVFGLIAFVAVAIIAIFGLVRGQDTTTLVPVAAPVRT